MTDLNGSSNQKFTNFNPQTLKARNETLVMTLKKKDAFAGMEAFVKHIYASLFLWVVKLLNAALSNGKKDAVNFIGILDIYGFVHCLSV